MQSLADAFKDRFERVGLEMNEIKTKALIVEGAKAPKMQLKPAFDRLHKREGKTHLERTLEKVQCQFCGFMSQRQGLIQLLLVECLVSDFQGSHSSVETLATSGLDVYAHNVEPIERLQKVSVARCFGL